MIYDKAMHEARKYWRERLPAMSFAGHVALDHPRRNGAQPQPRTATLERALDADVHALLRKLSGNNPFLAYTALVSALKICCYRMSGDPAVTIFSPATTEAAAANLLPINSAVDAGGTFKDALLSTKDVLSGAYKHQQYPFSSMQLDLPDERRTERVPLVATLAGLHGSSDMPSDVLVRFESTEAGTKSTVRFDAGIYDEATIANFFDLFHGFLKQALGNPGSRIADLRREERSPSIADDVRIHSLIEEEVALHPERVAIVEGDRATTYETLDADAARLAATLRGLALDPQKPVVLLMDAGTEMIVSILAVLKAGLAFAPVRLLGLGHEGTPASSPADQAASRRLGGQCIICRPEHVADLQDVDVHHLVTVSYANASLEITTAERGKGSDLPSSWKAYRSPELATYVRWLRGHCAIGADDRALLSPALDAGEQLCGIVGMLTAGGSIEVADLKDPAVLVARLLSPSITVWDLPTPLAQNLLPQLLAGNPRHIFLTGEKQSTRLAKAFPNAKVTGFYSPHAIGIRTTYFELQDEPVAAQAIPGIEHRVLHATGEPVPLRTRGELYVGGAATGLRVQPRDDGKLVWLRGDEHRFVKYGCTIELTEIESVLCAHEHIRAAEVIAVKTDQRADAIIVAFLLADSEELTPESASEYLVGNVDLIPDRFILLDEFPLAADGSIDRGSLVARFVSSRDGDVRSAAADVIQQQLKPIWLDILQVDDAADDESFFTRGGNSLKATLLIARIRDEFGVDLSVQKFFREPGLRAVAQLIAAESASASASTDAPEFKIVPRERYRVQLPELES